MLMKKPWQEHLFFIKGYRKHHTGATEGNIHTVNSTGWATGATICKPSKHIMSSYEFQQLEKRKMPIFPTRWQHMPFEWCENDCLIRAACCTGSQMIWPKIISVLNDLKKVDHSVNTAMNKRVSRLQNTRTKNKLDNNDNSQNQTDHLGLQQIELHNHNWSIFLSLLKPFFANKRFTPLDQILNHGISAVDRTDELKLGQKVEKTLITSANKALCL